MIFNCLTIFPEMFENFMQTSLAGKAIGKGLIEVNPIDFRNYTQDKHGRVDDYPFSGGAGMLLMPQPLFDCFDDVLRRQQGMRKRNIYLGPGGRTLTQEYAQELYTHCDVLNLLCGHYEGVDQRVLDAYIEEEVSIGDYVLTGGELPAMVLMDCVMRYVPGVMGNGESLENESFEGGLLEYPQYTRPQEFRGRSVPEVLLSGHHKNIERWKRQEALEKTWLNRPDLLDRAELDEEDRIFLEKLKTQT